MTFTDDDLKKVEQLQAQRMKTVTQKCCVICDKYLDSLLIRLEAAEDLIGIPIGSMTWNECYQRWHKVVGK